MATCKVPEAYLAQLCERYRKARKKERGKILDELVATTDYHRKYAIALLRGTRHHRNPQAPIRRLRRRVYLAEDKRAVLWLADLFDQISSKRLRAAMDAELDHVRADLAVSRACFQRLQHISPSTMDRVRRTERRPVARHRGGTKPGTLLKDQIKVRTFAEWDDKRPGFEEIDLVQHDGGNPSGFFACTLDVTDVSTGWTEMRAVPTKAQMHVFAALQHIRSKLPFPLLGLDSDNGAEFINDELVRYCDHEQLTFTRGRVGRKNDNPFVEQKNWSVVRRLVGYGRYETPRQVQQLNALYAVYRLYVNHFLPVQKLIGKVREGSRVKKIYDAPKTPYQRVLDSDQVSQEAKRTLRATHAKWKVVELRRQLDNLLGELDPSSQW
ncbi:MAG: hypothetical protein ACM3S0_13475 [Acidobacteriota bacterium]